MGETTGLFRQLLRVPEKPAPAMRRRMGPVASNAPDDDVLVTQIVRDQAGDWVYGPEIPAKRAGVQRPLPRGPEAAADRYFFRLEFTFEASGIARTGGTLPATLVVVEMPPGHATMFAVPLQTAGAKAGIERLPEAYDVAFDTDIRGRINPLGFSDDTLTTRRKDNDLEAIARICRARRDIYLTDGKCYRASLASELVADALFAFSPAKRESRWHPSHSAGGKRAQRLGIVMADFTDLDQVHLVIAETLGPRRDFWEKTVSRGHGIVAGQRFPVSPELLFFIDRAMELGAWQALGGADAQKAVGQGMKVSVLAGHYADHHLKVWNDALARGAAAFMEDISEAVAPVQEDFEILRLFDDIDSAPDELSRLQAIHRALANPDVEISGERRAREIKKIERRIDELSRGRP